MVEEEVTRFKHAYLQKKIDKMTSLTKEYKESIDKCRQAGISSVSMSLGELREMLSGEKQYLTNKQARRNRRSEERIHYPISEIKHT